MESKMKIAVIGLGAIAEKAHLQVLTQLENVELVFCTRNPEKLKQLANKHRIADYYTNYQDVLKSSVDAVMIHSATSSHFEIASFFLNHGIPVFVDKPLASTYAHCEKLHNLAEQKSTPLFMGFNRRYIPLYKQFLPALSSANEIDNPLLSLRWEKNRLNLTGDIRTFIFDDFIHPLDSVNIHASVQADDLHIMAQFDKQGLAADQLARLDVHWQQHNAIFHASMNRLNGATNETVSAHYRNQNYRFDSFVEGNHWQDDVERKIKLADWTPMLTSKGFDGMTKHWLSVIKSGKQELAYTQRNLHSHFLTELIAQRVSQSIK